MKVVVGSNLRLEIQMKDSHLPWTKKEQTSKVIDLESLFNDYWTSKEHEIVVLGQLCYPTNRFISDGEV